MNKPQPDQVTHQHANAFLVTTTGQIIGQLRDDKPDIDWPGRIGVFGGAVEDGETPLQAVTRELERG